MSWVAKLLSRRPGTCRYEFIIGPNGTPFLKTEQKLTPDQINELGNWWRAVYQNHEQATVAVEQQAEILRLRAELEAQRAGVAMQVGDAWREARILGAALNEMLAERDAARDALRKIADMVTPGSAPIGKRMAKVASDHLAGTSAPLADAA